MKEEDLFLIGIIIKPRGLKGALKITTGIPSGFPPFPFEVFIEKNGKNVPFLCDLLKIEPKDTIIHFSEVKTVEEAIPLVGSSVYIRAKDLKLTKKEFSYADLVGFKLIDQKEGVIGIIQKVTEFPLQWIGSVYENEIELLIPLNDDLINKIDKKNKNLFCNLPEGLLDIYRNT